jgi:hypothetical protein
MEVGVATEYCFMFRREQPTSKSTLLRTLDTPTRPWIENHSKEIILHVDYADPRIEYYPPQA